MQSVEALRRRASVTRSRSAPRGIGETRDDIAVPGMDSSSLHIYGLAELYGLPQLLCLAIAIAAGLVAATSYWRRHRTSLATPHSAPATGTIVYRDAPTVRLTDAQRIDRTRRVVRLMPGVHVDVLETRIGAVPRFRIALKRLVACEDGLAHIKVDFAGSAVSCGPLVEEIAFNEFVLPRANRDESRNCVFHCQDSGDTFSFMRIRLRAVDIAAGWADIDIVQVEGHWPPSGNA
jgi:hypothetical protein